MLTPISQLRRYGQTLAILPTTTGSAAPAPVTLDPAQVSALQDALTRLQTRLKDGEWPQDPDTRAHEVLHVTELQGGRLLTQLQHPPGSALTCLRMDTEGPEGKRKLLSLELYGLHLQLFTQALSSEELTGNFTCTAFGLRTALGFAGKYFFVPCTPDELHQALIRPSDHQEPNEIYALNTRRPDASLACNSLSVPVSGQGSPGERVQGRLLLNEADWRFLRHTGRLSDLSGVKFTS